MSSDTSRSLFYYFLLILSELLPPVWRTGCGPSPVLPVLPQIKRCHYKHWLAWTWCTSASKSVRFPVGHARSAGTQINRVTGRTWSQRFDRWFSPQKTSRGRVTVPPQTPQHFSRWFHSSETLMFLSDSCCTGEARLRCSWSDALNYI